MRFLQFVKGCSPAYWVLHWIDSEGNELTLPFPTDGDWKGAIAAESGGGAFEVWAARKPGMRMPAHERDDVGLEPRERIDPLTITIAGPEEHEGPQSMEPFDGIIPDNTLGSPVGAEMEKTRLIRAQIQRRRAETELLRFEQEQPTPLPINAPAAAPAGLDIMAQMMQQQTQLLQSMLDASMQREQSLAKDLREMMMKPPAATPAEQPKEDHFSVLTKTMEMVKSVLDMSAELRPESSGEEPSAMGNFLKVIGEGRKLMEAGGRMPTPAGAPMPNPQVQTGPKRVMKAVDPQTKAQQIGAKRAHEFMAIIVQEAQIGSDPASAAERIESKAGMLPLDIRTEIANGDWTGVWNAFLPFLGQAKWQQFDQILAASAELKQWVSVLVTEIADIWAPETESESGEVEGNAEAI